MNNNKVQAIVEKVKELVQRGNVSTVGFGCCVEVVKEDGNVVNVMDEEDAKRVRTAAQSAVSSVKDAVHFEKVVDQTTEATWTMPEEEKGAEPEVHTEEEHREE